MSAPASYPTNCQMQYSPETTDHFIAECGNAVSQSFANESENSKSGSRGTLTCRYPSCNVMFTCKGLEYRQHLKIVHPESCRCDECGQEFRSCAETEFHSYITGHSPYRCDILGCHKPFTSIATYLRHRKIHDESAQRYPCKYCKKYRGSNGFKRKDHLTQHLRGYHHHQLDPKRFIYPASVALDNMSYCPHEDCSEYRAEKYPRDHPFSKTIQYTDHMRKVHDESTFPCPEPGCERVRAKGYFRRAHLRNHLRKVHGTNGGLADDQNE